MCVYGSVHFTRLINDDDNTRDDLSVLYIWNTHTVVTHV